MGGCHGMGNMDSGKMSNMSDEPGRKNSKALEILKARYAKGEINKEEYEEMKKVILDEK